jgi:hypothetical protein
MGIFRTQDSAPKKNQILPFPHSLPLENHQSSINPLINLPFPASPFARGPVIAPSWICSNQGGELRVDTSTSFTKQNKQKGVNAMQFLLFFLKKLNRTTLLKSSILFHFNI